MVANQTTMVLNIAIVNKCAGKHSNGKQHLSVKKVNQSIREAKQKCIGGFWFLPRSATVPPLTGVFSLSFFGFTRKKKENHVLGRKFYLFLRRKQNSR